MLASYVIGWKWSSLRSLCFPQDADQRLGAVVNTALNLQFPQQKKRSLLKRICCFLASWEDICIHNNWMKPALFGIATATYWMTEESGIDFWWQGAKYFSFIFSYQTKSGSHMALYTTDNACSFMKRKAAGAWSSTLTSTWCKVLFSTGTYSKHISMMCIKK